MKGKKLAYISILLISILGHIIFGYYLERTEFYTLFTLYTFLFFCYIILFKFKDPIPFQFLIGTAILLRLFILFHLPNFSDDYFRFIWDGYLNYQGINPWLYTPENYFNTLNNPSQFETYLYENMNSPNYFTIYPTVCQVMFYVVNVLFPKNIWAMVVGMKAIVFMAEIGSLYFMIQLLKYLNIKKENVLIYAFNPLVIIELTGNIHFEILMILFLLMSVYYLLKKFYFIGAVGFILAVHAKLLPLIFLPLIIKYLGFKKGLIWATGVMIGVILLFLPFLDTELIYNFLNSIDLYFQKFEFNASIYYILRWIGFQIKGYNTIQTLGVILSVLTFIIAFIISFLYKNKRDNLFLKMLSILTTYFLLATVVHPWYLTTLLVLCIFTPFRFPIIWTFLVMLSYFTYKTSAYHENLWLTFIEYIGVLFVLILDLQRYKHILLKSNRIQSS